MNNNNNQLGPVQNILQCVAYMIISGFLRVVATMVLAYPDYIAKKHQQHQLQEHENNTISHEYGNDNNNNNIERMESLSSIRKKQWWFLISLHIFFLTVAAGFGIAGNVHGPVSIAIPVQTASQILLNAIVMGMILQMRTFDKQERIGTCIIFLAVLGLVDVGPGPQNGQNVVELLFRPGAILWNFVIVMGLGYTTYATIGFLFQDEQRNEESNNIEYNKSTLMLLLGVTLSNLAMSTSGKCLGYLTGAGFVLACFTYILSSLVGLLFSITSSTYCDQGLFTPACATALLLVNFVSGIIIWEDWKAIDTWVGYICVILIMCCGVSLMAANNNVNDSTRPEASRSQSTAVCSRHQTNDDDGEPLLEEGCRWLLAPGSTALDDDNVVVTKDYQIFLQDGSRVEQQRPRRLLTLETSGANGSALTS